MSPKRIIAIVLLGMLCSSALAQEVTPEEFQEHQKYTQKRMADQMLASQMMRASGDRMLQRELEIVQEQADELRKSAMKYQQDMTRYHSEHLEDLQNVAKLFQSGEHRNAIELSRKVFEKQEEYVGTLMETVEEVLLPHQLKRMMQITKQETVKRSNPYRDEFGVAVALADELELTPEEREQLIETVERVRTDYYEKLAEIKKEAQSEIMNSLPEAKRKKIKELLGESYDHDEQRRIAGETSRRQMKKRQTEMRRRQKELEAERANDKDEEDRD